MKRIIAAILVLLLLLGGTPTASAMTSPPTQWEGVRQAGVIPADTECPLEVKHMLLTFDVQNFANPHTSSEEELLAYTGKVTTEYTFYNPTDVAVTTKLLFLMGFDPHYDNLYDIDSHKYDIWVDGEAAEKNLCSGDFNLSYKVPYLYSDFSYWYEYEITLQPGQELVNTVTAPIYPTIDIHYEPPEYGYYYYPAPDFTWKSFGTLDVVINTPFHLLPRNSYYQFEKTGTGYKTSFDETHANWLSKDYLYFELCASENPEEVESGSNITWLLVLLLIYSEIVHAFNAIGEFFTNIFQFLF